MHLIRVEGKPCGLNHLVGRHLPTTIEEEEEDYYHHKSNGDDNAGNVQDIDQNYDLGSPSFQQVRWNKA